MVPYVALVPQKRDVTQKLSYGYNSPKYCLQKGLHTLLSHKRELL